MHRVTCLDVAVPRKLTRGLKKKAKKDKAARDMEDEADKVNGDEGQNEEDNQALGVMLFEQTAPVRCTTCYAQGHKAAACKAQTVGMLVRRLIKEKKIDVSLCEVLGVERAEALATGPTGVRAGPAIEYLPEDTDDEPIIPEQQPELDEDSDDDGSDTEEPREKLVIRLSKGVSAASSSSSSSGSVRFINLANDDSSSGYDTA